MACTERDLFLLIDQSAAVQAYMARMCSDLMYLINAIALETSVANGRGLPMPWEFVHAVQSLVLVKEHPSAKDSGAVANADVYRVFHSGNVRERCYQIFNITCRDKQNRILRWLLNQPQLPACIERAQVWALRRLCPSTEEPGHYTANDAGMVKKKALTVSRRRQRVRRMQQDASQDCLLVDADAVVPALSSREKALIGPEHMLSGKLPWVTGRQRWVLPDSVSSALSGNDPRKQLISGLSGHTESIIVMGRLFREFDINLISLVCVLWLAPCDHHSVFEILYTAKLHGLHFALHDDPVQFCFKLLQRYEAGRGGAWRHPASS